MKIKLLTITSVLATCGVAAYGQGTIQFANGSGSYVQINTGTGSVGASTGTYGTIAQLFYIPDTGQAAPTAFTVADFLAKDATFNAWTATTDQSATGFVTVKAGNGILTQVSGQTQQTQVTGNNVAPGANVWLIALAVANNSSTAVTSLTDPTISYAGVSTVWSQATGGSGSPPGSPISTSGNGFTGIVLTPVPEPSTIALAGLGAASLLLFRRRK